MIKSEKKFVFTNENGLECTVPLGAKIYTHVTDNGKGEHEVHGRILSEIGQELGWIRVNVINEDGGSKTATLPSDTVDLLVEAQKLVVKELTILNPKITFTT